MKQRQSIEAPTMSKKRPRSPRLEPFLPNGLGFGLAGYDDQRIGAG